MTNLTTLVRSARDAPPLLRWTVACAAAEAVGMTAAAGAAKAGQGVVVGLLLVVAGGLVEGLALGIAQATLLAGWRSGLRARRYVLITVLVAGLGWAAGSVPSVLAGDSGSTGTEPSLLLVLVGAAGIGLVMGPLLGAAQATVLRGAVPHPWRWVTANTLAWPLAMTLIFAGATAPGPTWPLPTVLLLGAVTGAVAGAALGLVSGWCLPSLTGASLHNQWVLRRLGSHHRFGLDARLVGLGVPARRSGRLLELPVQYAVDGGDLVVVPGHAERKTWWRNLRGAATLVPVLVDGSWRTAEAEVLEPGDPDYVLARAAYQRRWPRPVLPSLQPVVRLRGVATPR